MQFIDKSKEPPSDWAEWVRNPAREETEADDVDYDNAATDGLRKARKRLIDEQHGLCAYCQQTIDLDHSRIEHLVPNSLNKVYSKSYYNLVAVCNGSEGNINGSHCDVPRLNKPLFPMVLHNDAEDNRPTGHGYLSIDYNGMIKSKADDTRPEGRTVCAFIETLNLNHHQLVNNRRDKWDRLKKRLPRSTDKSVLNAFLKSEYDRIAKDFEYEYRQFVLMAIRKKLSPQF
jgi:uncharacterized protein (TIGR02646 family)